MPAWSYSSLSAFEQCPRRYNLTRIAKVIKEPQTEATLHGNAVHKALELSVRDALPLPEKYKDYSKLVDVVRHAPGVKHTEHKFALTRNLTPTEYWGKDVWVRGVLDLRILVERRLTIIDWKTGKPKPDADQLELFAGVGFALHPNVDTIRTAYAWLAHNKLDRQIFRRGDEKTIWLKFIPRVQAMDEAIDRKDYPPKPSGLCRQWCPVPRSMCEFSGKT